MVKVVESPIPPEELVTRVRTLLAREPEDEMLRATVEAPPADPRTHAMRVALGGLAAPPATVGGRRVRSLTGTLIKRAARKAIAWYVEPRWRAQAMFDEQVVSLAADVEGFRQQVLRAESDLAAHTAALSERVMELSERLDALVREITLRFEPPAIDYVRFEERFRGDSSEVRAAQADYVERFRASPSRATIVDIGCGRGEMLELLRDAGLDAIGVDADQGMLDVCRAKQLDVADADGVRWLAERADGSLGGIFMAQVVEHLPTHELVQLVALAATKLEPGGLFIAETLDPRSLFATANFFWADLSHVRPVYPATLAFLAEQAGFSSVEILGRSRHELADLPPPSDSLTPDPVDDHLAEDQALAAPSEAGSGQAEPGGQAAREIGQPVEDAVRALLETVYGSQDYALIAAR